MNFFRKCLNLYTTMKKQVTVFPNNININIVGEEESGEVNLWWGNGVYSLYFDDDERLWLFDIEQTFLLEPDDLESGFKTVEEAVDALKNRICDNINETLIDF